MNYEIKTELGRLNSTIHEMREKVDELVIKHNSLLERHNKLTKDHIELEKVAHMTLVIVVLAASLFGCYLKWYS